MVMHAVHKTISTHLVMEIGTVLSSLQLAFCSLHSVNKTIPMNLIVDVE